MPGLQPSFCAAASLITDADMSCEDWGGYGYVESTVDIDAFNAALATLEGLELALLTGACEAVNDLLEDNAQCADHDLGHLCHTAGLTEGSDDEDDWDEDMEC